MFNRKRVLKKASIEKKNIKDEIQGQKFPKELYKGVTRESGKNKKIKQARVPSDDARYSVCFVKRKNIILPQLEKIRKITNCPHLCIFESKAEIDVYVTLDKYKKVFDRVWQSLKSSSQSFESDMMECLDSQFIKISSKRIGRGV